MRLLVLLGALGISGVAHAADIRIHVDYTTSVYRVRPNPETRTSQHSFDVVMHPDNRIEDHYQSAGNHPVSGDTTHRMGDAKFQVVDSHTITRRQHSALTTITVSGRNCEARVQVTRRGEFQDFSTQLGVSAVYRDLQVLRTSCTIR